jgi:small basic protein (TIGR04137 family)
MSIDRSLKAAGGLARHRNVLSRAERVEKMLAKEKFNMQSGDPLGLPKVANRKVSTGKAAAKKKDAAAEGTPAA